MERVSRLIVTGSIALAGVTHAWLVNWQPGVRLAAGVAFVAMFVLARVNLRIALAAVLGLTFVAPALLATIFGTPEYHQIIVWLAGLAGVLLAQRDSQRWHVPANWTTPLALWALVVAVTWPIVAMREVDFSVVALQSVHSTNPLLQASPRLAAAFVVILALTQLLGIVWLDALWANYRNRPTDFARFVAVPLIASAVVGALAGIYQRFVDLSWMNLHIWSNMQRAGGLMQDANAFGTGAAFLAPAALALVWFTGSGRFLGVLAMIILTAGMWAAGSRTALLVFGSGMVALIIALLRERGLWHRNTGHIVAAVAVVAMIGAAAVVPRNFESSNPLERAFARIPPLEASEIKRFATELWVRFGYGRAADLMVLEHPISGVGVGAFHVVAPEYIYRDIGRVLPSDNAQNWWRHQLAELGVLGAMPAVWFSIIVALLCRADSNSATTRTATTLRGSLVGLGLASLVGVPTQGPAMTLTFGTMLFWLAIARPLRTADGSPPTRVLRPWMAIIPLVVATSLAISARGDLRVPHRAARAAVPYSYGLMAPQEVSQYGEIRWMGRRAVWVLPASARWLRLSIWAPYPDIRSNAVDLEVRVNGSETISTKLSTSGPTALFVEVTGAAGVLEMRASRELLPGRALQLAASWHREVPPSVEEDKIFRHGAAH